MSLTPILCLGVVFGHVASHAIQNLNKTSFQFISLYIVWRLVHSVVPVFIALSAAKICIKYKDKTFDFKQYLNFMKGRIVNIYILYLIWIMIFYIYFCSIGYFSFNIVDYIGYAIKGDISAPFYFVVVIMQFYIFMPIWLYIVKNQKAIFIIPMAILIMIILIFDLPGLLEISFNINFKYNDRIFTSFLLYWISGCYIGTYYDNFRTLIKENKKTITSCFVFLAILDVSLAYIQSLGIKVFTSLEVIHMFYCAFTILFLFTLFSDFENKNNIFISILYNINKCSFYIYLSHCLVINIIDNTFENNNITDIGTIFITKFIFTYLICIAVSNIYIYLKTYFKTKFKS